MPTGNWSPAASRNYSSEMFQAKGSTTLDSVLSKPSWLSEYSMPQFGNQIGMGIGNLSGIINANGQVVGGSQPQLFIGNVSGQGLATLDSVLSQSSWLSGYTMPLSRNQVGMGIGNLSGFINADGQAVSGGQPQMFISNFSGQGLATLDSVLSQSSWLSGYTTPLSAYQVGMGIGNPLNTDSNSTEIIHYVQRRTRCGRAQD